MNIGIIGLGLIGGSLGRALVKGTEHKVLGYDIDKSSMLKGQLLQAYTDELTDENISDVDVLVLAVVPSVAIKIMEKKAPLLKRGATVIDCCGTKRIVTDAMASVQKRHPYLSFVGVHPMAGREFSGIAHSTAGLFEKAYIIMVPVHTPIDALVKVKRMFDEIGCEGVVVTNAEKHDRIIAYTSQLAHIVSSAYIKSPTSAEHVGYSAGSFRDMTRVAKLNPDMWTELFLENRVNLLHELDELIIHLNEYRNALDSDNASELNVLLETGVKCKEYAEKLRKEGASND